MVKATELQIGDWVKCTNPPYIQVASITKKKMGYHLNPNEPRMHYVRLCEIEPIPLTPEILEKNGWRKEFDKKDYMVLYDLPETSDKSDFNVWMMWCVGERSLSVNKQSEDISKYNLCHSRIDIPCDYVHQLQHALRLCGIKKEIEL